MVQQEEEEVGGGGTHCLLPRPPSASQGRSVNVIAPCAKDSSGELD